MLPRSVRPSTTSTSLLGDSPPSPERGYLSWFSRYGREGHSGMEKPFPCGSTFPSNPCHLGAMLFSKLCQFRDLPRGVGA